MAVLNLDQRDRVLTVRIDNPPRNFLDERLIAALDDLTLGLRRDRSVGAVVLESALPGVWVQHADVERIVAASRRTGRALSVRQAAAAGRALDAVLRLPAGASLVRRTRLGDAVDVLRLDNAFARMNRSDKVFIAAIDGVVMGGGLMLALACDVRLLSDTDHWIGLPEILLGYVPGVGTAQRLARAVGPHRALRMLVAGDLVDADQALKLGLVDEVVHPAELSRRAHDLAHRLAARPAAMVESAKRSIYEAERWPLRRANRYERAGLLSGASTARSREVQALYLRLGGGAPETNEQVARAFEAIADGDEVRMNP
ncbi:MAG TPA: enoyl-CoA hydratase/isomerase family protein [Solirubrobacteraceae bacterium]|nr:enoyl-CoA hydratase/isomerase family protein [Solirubrobacteraceae bacterium]